MTVWKREVEAPEVRDEGYLRLLQTRSPGETFRGEQSAFKAQGEGGGKAGAWRGPHWKGRSVMWRSDGLPPSLSAVSTLLTLLPPPVLKCRQFTVAGKHLTVLKGEQMCWLEA